MIFFSQSLYGLVGLMDALVGPVKKPAVVGSGLVIDRIVGQERELNAGKVGENLLDHFFIASHQLFLTVIGGIHVIGADIEENAGRFQRVNAGFHMLQHFRSGETAHAAVINNGRKAGTQLKFVDGELLHQTGPGEKDLTGNSGFVEVVVTGKFQRFFGI